MAEMVKMIHAAGAECRAAEKEVMAPLKEQPPKAELRRIAAAVARLSCRRQRRVAAAPAQQAGARSGTRLGGWARAIKNPALAGFFMFSFCLHPAFSAHCTVAVIAAQNNLLAFKDYITVIIKSSINSGFCTAIADHFNFCN